MLYQFQCSVCKSVTIYVSRNPRERLWCCRKVRVAVAYPAQSGGLTPRAADGYAASQQAQLFTADEQPAKVSGKSRRR